MPVDMKAVIAGTYLQLVQHGNVDKITVKALIDACHISRQTFYYHFRDIYDLVEWACQEDARRILDGKRTYTTWQEGFRRILDGLIDNRPFILNVYRSVRREQVETFLFQVTHGLLMGVVEELDPIIGKLLPSAGPNRFRQGGPAPGRGSSPRTWWPPSWAARYIPAPPWRTPSRPARR